MGDAVARSIKVNVCVRIPLYLYTQLPQLRDRLDLNIGPASPAKRQAITGGWAKYTWGRYISVTKPLFRAKR